MRLRRGPRPFAIRWFAALFVAGAALGLVDALRSLDTPGIDEWVRDATIVGGSVRFTIALMTVGMVWFFALRIARWLVPGVLLLKIGATIFAIAAGGSISFIPGVWWASTAFGVAAAIFLFTPSAGRWFARDAMPVDDVFA